MPRYRRSRGTPCWSVLPSSIAVPVQYHAEDLEPVPKGIDLRLPGKASTLCRRNLRELESGAVCFHHDLRAKLEPGRRERKLFQSVARNGSKEVEAVRHVRPVQHVGKPGKHPITEPADEGVVVTVRARHVAGSHDVFVSLAYFF